MNRILRMINSWIVNENRYSESEVLSDEIDWVRTLPFILVNLGCLLVFFVGYSWVAVTTALVLYFVRLFSIGAFYHRFFSHKTYQTNRFWKFIFAVIGASSAQR